MMNQFRAVIFVTLAVTVYAFPLYEQYNEFPVKQYNEFPPVKRSCRNSSVTLDDDDLMVLQKFMGFFSNLMQNRYYGRDMTKDDAEQMNYGYNNNIGNGYDLPKYQKPTMTSTTTPATTASTTTRTTTTTTRAPTTTTTTTTKAYTTGLTIDPKLLESIMRKILCNCKSPNHSVRCKSLTTMPTTTTKATTTTTTTRTTTTTMTTPTTTTTMPTTTTTTYSDLPTKPKKRLCFKTFCIKIKDDKGYIY